MAVWRSSVPSTVPPRFLSFAAPYTLVVPVEHPRPVQHVPAGQRLCVQWRTLANSANTRWRSGSDEWCLRGRRSGGGTVLGRSRMRRSLLRYPVWSGARATSWTADSGHGVEGGRGAAGTACGHADRSLRHVPTSSITGCCRPLQAGAPPGPSPGHLRSPPVVCRVPLGSPPASGGSGRPCRSSIHPPVPAVLPGACARKGLPSAPGIRYNPHSL